MGNSNSRQQDDFDLLHLAGNTSERRNRNGRLDTEALERSQMNRLRSLLGYAVVVGLAACGVAPIAAVPAAAPTASPPPIARPCVKSIDVPIPPPVARVDSQLTHLPSLGSAAFHFGEMTGLRLAVVPAAPDEDATCTPDGLSVRLDPTLQASTSTSAWARLARGFGDCVAQKAPAKEGRTRSALADDVGALLALRGRMDVAAYAQGVAGNDPGRKARILARGDDYRGVVNGYLVARLAMRFGRVEAATSAFDALAEVFPDSPEVDTARAVALLTAHLRETADMRLARVQAAATRIRGERNGLLPVWTRELVPAFGVALADAPTYFRDLSRIPPPVRGLAFAGSGPADEPAAAFTMLRRAAGFDPETQDSALVRYPDLVACSALVGAHLMGSEARDLEAARAIAAVCRHVYDKSRPADATSSGPWATLGGGLANNEGLICLADGNPRGAAERFESAANTAGSHTAPNFAVLALLVQANPAAFGMAPGAALALKERASRAPLPAVGSYVAKVAEALRASMGEGTLVAIPALATAAISKAERNAVATISDGFVVFAAAVDRLGVATVEGNLVARVREGAARLGGPQVLSLDAPPQRTGAPSIEQYLADGRLVVVQGDGDVAVVITDPSTFAEILKQLGAPTPRNPTPTDVEIPGWRFVLRLSEPSPHSWLGR